MLKDLKDIYKEKGDSFLKDLFKYPVMIFEKMSGSNFSFEMKNGSPIFYKGSNVEITTVDRVLNKFYEKGIRYIENKLKTIQCPERIKFCFEYFPNHKPNYIYYDKLPKNYLILSHIIDNKVVISEGEEFTKWTELLNVDTPPIIFNDKLANTQKSAILELLHKEPSIIEIIKILNPKLAEKYNDENIFALYFKFKTDDKPYTIQLKNEYIDSLKQESKPQSNFLPIIYAQMIEFMSSNSINIKKVKLKSKDTSNKYLELMDSFFVKFIDEYKSTYKDFKLSVPDFMDNEDFKVNLSNIDNEEVFKLLNQSVVYQDIYKIFLNLFRKQKKTDNNFLDPHQQFTQNTLVSLIEDKIFEGKIEEYIRLVESKEDEDLYSTEDTIVFRNRKKDVNDILYFWQQIFDERKKKEVKEIKEDGQEEIILFVREYTILSDVFVKELDKVSGKKYLIHISTNKKVDDLIDEQFTELKKEGKIEGFLIVDNPSLLYLDSQFKDNKITKIYCGKVSGLKYKLEAKYYHKEIEVLEIGSKKYEFKELKDLDYTEFKKIAYTGIDYIHYKIKDL